VDDEERLPALAGGLPEDAARRLVGPRADYYLVRWAWIERSGRSVGFNWAAFFIGPFWMLYRRMYRTFGWVLAALILSVVLEIVAARLLGVAELPRVVERGINLGAGIVIGLYGSYWYFLEVRRRYDRIRARDGFTAADFDRVGGVSGGAAILGVVVVALLFLVSMTLQTRVG
jgi:hypothetical protein